MSSRTRSPIRLYARSGAPDAAIQAARDLLADEAHFIDLPGSPIFVVQEREIWSAQQ
jgi:hypothetical protein